MTDGLDRRSLFRVLGALAAGVLVAPLAKGLAFLEPVLEPVIEIGEPILCTEYLGDTITIFRPTLIHDYGRGIPYDDYTQRDDEASLWENVIL